MFRVKLRGRYEILKKLGSGGFSETYLARDLDFPGSPQCVVKQLKPQCDDEWGLQTARRLFDSEASVLSRLGSHPQIPQLMAYFEEEQQFYLVQEFIEGEQLSEELDPERQWIEELAIAFLEDTLGVLAFIHSHEVVHRDLKPENIIRRARDRRLVLIDFGAIKEITGDSIAAPAAENLTIAVGTPAYMPVEQQSGKPRLNSDIYALGLIAIQGLTGVSPKYLPEDAQTGEFLWRDLAQVSEPLASLLDGMIRWNHRERYQSVEEVLEDLQQCQRHKPARSTDLSSVPSAVLTPDERVLSEVVRALDQHPDRARIRKLLFCAFAGYWENDASQTEAYTTDELLLGLYQAHSSQTELSDTLYAVVKTLNKQAKYFAVFNIIVRLVDRLYRDDGSSYENGSSAGESLSQVDAISLPQPAPEPTPPPASTSPDPSRQPPGDSSANREGSEATAAHDPFDLRAEIVRYTTPLRAKILLFSLLYFQFGYGGQDWSVLMTHELDTLIEKALQEYKHLDELEARLQRIAEGFGSSERQESIQAATAISQALRTVYDYR